ncbi:MAG: phosphoglucosamine mutase [SAR86 cluster bacterium]|uniref:Phosphoglucosamine mutase n=1 Tax=SAR86 cluster bacterium TaxID=2030880 RepID=A0A2A5CHA1_9GAMM|nr:phosphoglucosamine mutase [Gammaproteobacteria bacterium AH-315-E17]PCJ42830.1 MAG: phosphoglucosamine mutase [SAR86 cluster bacterium]
MNKTKKYFGTDGIRGRVGEYPVTPDFFLKLGWAIGKVFSKKSGSTVLIGKDTRISGYMFESALEAGLTSAGVDIKLLGPMPTPAVAHLTSTFQAQAGIVISASHNGYEDNGIKLFSAQGTKLGDDIEFAIEDALDSELQTVSSDKIGKASRIIDASGRYIEFCKGTVQRGIKFNGLKIVLDCANGATYHIAPNVFEELGADIKVIGNKPNGLNINNECGSTKPQQLADEVLKHRADLGIAFDGDGDRVQMVDHTGEVVDGDELLYIIAMHKLANASKDKGVVGTVMSNLGLELALQDLKIPFCRSSVGDRYVMEELKNREWFIGGESSGHVICLDKTTTGDGIVAALQVLAAMQEMGKSLYDLKSMMEKFPQTMINVRLKDPKALNGNKVIHSAVKDAELTLGKEGRVLLRPSGTEPMVRVMVEGSDETLVNKLATDLSQVVSRELA